MNFDQMLAELGSILGLEGFARTEDGDVTASFDNIYVTLDYFDDHVYLLSKLTDLPDDKLPAYAFLLEANSFGKLDGYVGIAAEQSAIIFVTKIPAELAQQASYVAERLEKHVNAAETLVNGLERFSSSKQGEAPANTPENTGNFIKV